MSRIGDAEEARERLERKRFTSKDMAVVIVCLMIVFTGLGYFWCFSQKPFSVPTNMICIADLSMEISKGKEFWLPVDNDNMLHFLPLRKAQYEMAIRREKR